MISEFGASPSRAYVGLRAFAPREHILFFGRAADTNNLLARLERDRLLAVTGAAGTGKSSLILAGLLPALHGGLLPGTGRRWRTAVFRPGGDAIGALARTLSAREIIGPDGWDKTEREAVIDAVLRHGSLGLLDAVRQARLPPTENLLVVVDQFEDLFRLAVRTEDSEAFVKLLLEAAGQVELPIYVVLIFRAAYLGDCARFRGLPETMGDGPHLVPRLTRDEAREAITGPAKVCGAEVAPRLLDRLLNDLGSDPERLPTFQHALMRTWESWWDMRRVNEPIDLRHYEAIGKMPGALEQHAEEAFEELPDERSRAVAAKLFAALATNCTDGREIRCVMKLKDLCALIDEQEPKAAAVIETFRREDRSFLTPVASLPLKSESLLEISYENLIHNWPRLRAWAARNEG